MFDIKFITEAPLIEALGKVFGVVGSLVAALAVLRRWWRGAKPLRMFGSLEPYDVPPVIELHRRRTRTIELIPGVDRTVEFTCVPSVPWEVPYIDVRFVQKRYSWLPNWLWLPQHWYPTDNVFDGCRVNFVKVLTKEGVDESAHRWNEKPGTVGGFSLEMLEKPVFPVSAEVWFRATVDVRPGWSGYLSLRAPFSGRRRIARCRVRVSEAMESEA